MSTATAIRLGERGVLTLPKGIRDAYHLESGAELTLLDLDGAIVITPRRSEVDALADKVARKLAARGESLQSMLSAVREERERYGR